MSWCVCCCSTTEVERRRHIEVDPSSSFLGCEGKSSVCESLEEIKKAFIPECEPRLAAPRQLPSTLTWFGVRTPSVGAKFKSIIWICEVWGESTISGRPEESLVDPEWSEDQIEEFGSNFTIDSMDPSLLLPFFSIIITEVAFLNVSGHFFAMRS